MRLRDAAEKLARRREGSAPACAMLPRKKPRIARYHWAASECPRLNVLVNNAVVQRRVDLPQQEQWEQTWQEIATKLEAPIYFSRLSIPVLSGSMPRENQPRNCAS